MFVFIAGRIYQAVQASYDMLVLSDGIPGEQLNLNGGVFRAICPDGLIGICRFHILRDQR